METEYIKLIKLYQIKEEDFQRIADEYCEKKGIPAITVKLDYEPIYIADYSPICNEITLSFDRNETDLKHELRHHYSSVKTKHLSTLFGAKIVPYAAAVAMVAGKLLGNNYMLDLASIFWAGHFMVEVYADFDRASWKSLAFDLGMMTVPLLFKF